MSIHTKDNSQLPYSHLHFPAKLYQIIEEESDEIICWKEDGLSFRIVDHTRFERELMPKYFRHRNISSVQRQLNLYGFKCVGRGENKGCFFHPDFKRDEFEIVKQIRRNPRNKKGLRDKSSASYFLLPNKSNSYKGNNNSSSNHNNHISNSNTTAESSSTNSSILDGDGQVIYDGTDDIFSEKHTDLFETIPNIFFNGSSNGTSSNCYNNELYHLRERKSFKRDDNSYEDSTSVPSSSSSNELSNNVSAMSASLTDKVKKNLGQQYHQTLVNRVGNSRLNPNFSDYISNFYSFDQIEAQFINTPKVQQQPAKKSEPPPSEPYTSSDSVEDLFKFCQSLEDYYTVTQNSHQPAQNASTDQDNEQNQKVSQQYRRQPLTKQQQQQYQYYTQKMGQKWN